MTDATSQPDDDAEDPGDPSYAYKPSLMGAPSQFILRSDALHWQVGRYDGRIPYDRITFVRMSFRPVTLQMHRYLTEIWSANHPKVQFASASWRSLTEQQRLDAAYNGFATELHRRIAAAGGRTEFITGLPAWSYWIGVGVFGIACAAMAVLVVRALQLGEWSAAAMIGVLFLVFGYQLGQYFHRNRPGRYRADAIPPQVMPRPERRLI